MNKTVIYSLLMVFLSFFIHNSTYALCVNVPIANLRSGPGTKYEKTWEVYKYMPFKRLSKKGNWYKVKDVDGDKHWIYRKLVTNKYDCAVAKKRANIRKGPGMGYRILGLSPVIKYESFKVLKTKGQWVNVMNEYGDKGWIFRKLLWIY
jgi:uncharacterized protein YgiM (DUF1202 family)